MLKFITASLLIAYSAFAQTPAGLQSKTLGMANGRLWAAMPLKFEKVCYLTGIKDAILATAAPHADYYFAPEFSAGEVADSIDVFYATPENVRIPIIFALQVSVAKFKGSSATDLETMTTAFRKVSASN